MSPLAGQRLVHQFSVDPDLTAIRSYQHQHYVCEGRLAGGLYGITLGACFFGESMFSRERDASKVALVDLVYRLRRGGFTLLDTQFSTLHLSRFGVIEVGRDEYRRRLTAAINTPAELPTEQIAPAELSAFIDQTV